ncbi:MAG: hypothetical protein NTU53_24575, partial [Planctomycetota bacterium]|nr:hypothetical protein [Planctomycetota bacterium]
MTTNDKTDDAAFLGMGWPWELYEDQPETWTLPAGRKQIWFQNRGGSALDQPALRAALTRQKARRDENRDGDGFRVL